MPGPIDEELTKRGCEDLGGGYWTHPGYEGGQRRMGRNEAIAWTLQGEGARLRALTERIDDQEKLEERVEWFQKQMDAIRNALGLQAVSYSDLAEAARVYVETRQARHKETRSNIRSLIPAHLKELIEKDPNYRWWEQVFRRIDELTDNVSSTMENVASHEQAVGVMANLVLRSAVLPGSHPRPTEEEAKILGRWKV